MSFVQPRLGVYNTTPFLFSQQPSQPIAISSLPRTRLNGSVQNVVISQKSVPKSVTQVTQSTETKRLSADREVIVLSSDSESDTETKKPVVSRKMKGKEKGDVSYVNKGMRNKNLEASASIIVDQPPTSNSGVNRSSVADDNNHQYMDIGSLSNETKSTHDSGISTNKKNLLDDYDLIQSNKEEPSLSRSANPVRIFLNILEDHKTNVGLFEIIVDFTRIYLEIYNEDKRIITKIYDFQTLVVDLIYCLMSKMKDDRYMATSERFKQVELLAQKAIEVIDKIKETGEIIKGVEDYKRAQPHDERKRRNVEEGNSQEDKRRKQGDDRRFVDEGDKLEMDKREEKKREYKRQEEQRRREQQRLREEKRSHEELENGSVRKNWEELKKQMKSQVSVPAPSQTDDEAKFVELMAEPLHDLITAQLVYDLYKNFTPFHLSETVNRCTVNRIFKFNYSEKNEYCKQLYRQYINTNMKGTTNVLEGWIKTRITENAKPYLSGKKR